MPASYPPTRVHCVTLRDGPAPPRKRGGERDGNRKGGIWIDSLNRFFESSGEKKGLRELVRWLRVRWRRGCKQLSFIFELRRERSVGNDWDSCDWEIKEKRRKYWHSWMINIIILESIGSLKMNIKDCEIWWMIKIFIIEKLNKKKYWYLWMIKINYYIGK